MRSHAAGITGPWLAVATLAAAGAAAAAGYALTAPKEYRATAQLLVTPVAASDTAFTGIDVLRDSGGKRTAAASTAALVRGPLVADAVRALLGLRRSRDSLLASLDSHVVDSSDVVAVTVEDASATGAAQLANAFADTLVAQRTASFQSEVAAAVRRYSGLLSGMTAAERASAAGAELARRLAALESVQGQPDPTLKHAGQATAPASSAWPDVPKLTALGAGVGAALGVVSALVLLAARRRGRPGLPQYDRAMPDRALEQLVDRLEARLAARESALAAREKDLQEVLDELRAAQAQAAPAREVPAGEAQPAAGDSDLRRRERALEQRVAAVTKRERELARRTAELTIRERAADEADRAAEEAAPAAPEPEREREPEPPPPPPVATAAPSEGRYNLTRLERLVEERGAEFPDRADEWSSYLYFLREHAAADGSVPPAFDWLIQDTFGELVL
jgi:chaperonin cofactor prefoldin